MDSTRLSEQGPPARGGEDLDICFRLIGRGYSIVYNPRSYVLHRHPRDYVTVSQKCFDYGVGLTAFLLKSVLADPTRLIDISGRLPYAIHHVFSDRSPKNRVKGAEYPPEFGRRELSGMFYGPTAYLRSLGDNRRRARRQAEEELRQVDLSPNEVLPGVQP